MSEEVLILFTTWPDAEKARAAARILVNERLIACANLIPGVESIYRWQGKIESSTEVLMLIKTTIGRYQTVEERIRGLHGYEVPEILSVRVEDGLPSYLRWVEENCFDVP